MTELMGNIFNIQRFSTEDGPGIRTSVFFKGCPLTCTWCSNPESQKSELQTACRPSQCITCGSCTVKCPDGALTLVQDEEGNRHIEIDHTKCCSCGTCIETCPAGAMKFYGRHMTVADIYDIVIRDKQYYQTSGGGLTCSGGECMMQADVVEALFRMAKREGIHCTLDTCGFFNTDRFLKMADVVDLVLYDLKLMDCEQHKIHAGVPNEIILENARVISKLGIEMFIRVPLIPGITDTDENLHAIAKFVSEELPSHPVINILPYHNYGENKYEMLGMEYIHHGAKKQTKERQKEIVALFESYGLECLIA